MEAFILNIPDWRNAVVEYMPTASRLLHIIQMYLLGISYVISKFVI